MSDETRQVLEMLSEGKVSVLEAEQLLNAAEPALVDPDVRIRHEHRAQHVVDEPAEAALGAVALAASSAIRSNTCTMPSPD